MSEGARAAADAADAKLLRDRVTAAFGDHYLIGHELGRGGMAVVYAAEDVRLQRQVALKVLPPDLAFRSDVRERFVREAQTAARLNHPHIVPIFAVHEHSGMVCFAMGLVTGESVAAHILRDSRPSFEFVASILEQTADALAYAHSSGVVHRDVKPDNILLDKESLRAMVTDFGIARAAESGSRLTQTGIAVGTPAFMSPEQATGDKDVDGRSDLYSLGVVGYLMLAGRLPFEATTTPAMLVKHVSETPPPIFHFRPDAPASLVGILEKCLGKRPSDRWNSALEMRDALRRAQRDGSLTTRGDGAVNGYASNRYPAVGYPAAASAQQYANTQRDRVASEYADKAGHRAEDWTPRVPLPGEAPRRDLPAPLGVPPIPNFPPPPATASREELREWKSARREALRDWRSDVKEQRRDARELWRDNVQLGAQQWAGGVLSTRSDEELISRFRSQVLWTGGMIAFLAMTNVATSRQFPWAIFPAFGMTMGVIGRYSKLRARGIRWSQIWGDHDGAIRDEGEANLPKATRIARTVNAFKRHAKWLVASVVAAGASFAIGAGMHADPMVIPFVGSLLVGIASGQMLLMDYLRLRRFGVGATAVLNGSWEDVVLRSDDRPHAIKVDEELRRIAGPSLLRSALGDTVRAAVDDRIAIKDASMRMSDADKMIVPDVEPTAEALLERIGALASGLERLDHDIPGSAITELEVRIAAAEAESVDAPDHERRLSLLLRQRSSLLELVDRRGAMQRQLESASMQLRSLRLDMVKLRTLGVGATIGDGINATQEARALSIDIGRALDAAAEVRKL